MAPVAVQEIHWRTLAEIRDVLNEMLMLPEAAAGAIARGVSQGKPGHKPPPGIHLRDSGVQAERSMVDIWGERFNRCSTDREARRLLMVARVQLHEVQHRQEKGRRQYTEDEMTQFMLALEGWDSREAAILCGPTIREEAVRRTRLRDGRDPDTGGKIPGMDRSDENDVRAAARALREGEGLSFRAIASRLGVSHTTVARWCESVLV